MKAFTAILMATVAAVRLTEGGQEQSEEDRMTDEQLARDLDESTCGYFLQSMQQYIGLPLNDENEERIKNTIAENGRDVNKIAGAIKAKVGKCHDEIREIEAESIKDWTCEEFINNGKDKGWLNPVWQEWKELFDPSEKQWKAMEERYYSCHDEFHAVQRDHFGDWMEAEKNDERNGGCSGDGEHGTDPLEENGPDPLE